MIITISTTNGRIDHDIRVETREGGLMSIPGLHPSHEALG